MATAEMRSNAAPGGWGGRRGVGQRGRMSSTRRRAICEADPSEQLRRLAPALGTTHGSRASGQAVAGGCRQQSFGVGGDGGARRARRAAPGAALAVMLGILALGSPGPVMAAPDFQLKSARRFGATQDHTHRGAVASAGRGPPSGVGERRASYAVIARYRWNAFRQT